MIEQVNTRMPHSGRGPGDFCVQFLGVIDVQDDDHFQVRCAQPAQTGLINALGNDNRKAGVHP